MIIRDAQNKDIPQLLLLLSEVLEIHAKIKPDYFVSGHTKYSEPELEAILKAEDVKVYVADENGEVLGYAFCILQETLHKPFVVSFKYMYIDDLCVNSACRGKGIGKKLFAHVCEEAKALGCRDITLNVWEGNDSARAFYESLGMKVQKTTMEITL